MQTQAAVTRGKGQPFTIEEVELAEPASGEVLVRLVGTGLCETDLMVRDEWYSVPFPAVLGHEGAGIVEAVGKGVRRVAVGDAVVLTFLACGACGPCQLGRPPYCQRMLEHNLCTRRIDGSTGYRLGGAPLGGHFFGQSSFARHSLADERSVVKVPGPVAPELLELVGSLGCGIQAGAGAILSALRPPAASRVAVFGAGLVGLSAVMAARALGCTTIVAVDPQPARLELAETVGATETVNAELEDVVTAVRDITDGGADYALETTGNAEVLRAAADSTRTMGTCAVVGPAPVGTEAVLDVNLLLFGRTLRGVMGGDTGPGATLPTLLALHRKGLFPFDRLARTYPLENINRAVEDTLNGTVFKPIIRFA
jgi:aryl-alcohol dehydrogenase